MATVTTAEDAQALREQASRTIRDHLPEFAAELLDWDQTAVLRNGRVRDTANLMREVIPGPHTLSFVRGLVEVEAYRQVIAGVTDRLTPAQHRFLASMADDPATGTRIECKRSELRVARSAATQGLLRGVPTALGTEQTHFEVIITPLGEAVIQAIAPHAAATGGAS